MEQFLRTEHSLKRKNAPTTELVKSDPCNKLS